LAELVADCPRCRSKRITFDVIADLVIGTKYDWQQLYEAFCVCRHCLRSTVFVLADKEVDSKNIINKAGLSKVSGIAAGNLVRVENFISVKDAAPVDPPEHLPEDILVAFKEGARCLSVGCFNAAGTMFRLCVDFATKAKLPEADRDGLNVKVRRSLGLRLQWLFANSLLPAGLQELSSCIKEDGNDGAHAGSLSQADAEDLLDFTTALLERLYTEPKRLEIAKARREARRTG
jgi:hypothetical protein